MNHSESLISEWKDGTVILSPRDLDPKQLLNFSEKIRKLNGKVLFDSQFYLPAEDHSKLQKHDYWPQNYASGLFWSGVELTRLVEKIFHLNSKLNTEFFILPGLFAQTVDKGWIHRQKSVIDEAIKIGTNRENLYATVALSGEATKNDKEIHLILDEAVNWNVEGIYLVCEHPKGEYLVSDPNWLANVLDLTSGLRLMGKKVILGYCSHQMVIASVAAANAIASGTWMNVRSFPPDKFRQQYGDEFKQRTTWYYCPESLSEYKISFLDIALKQGALDLLHTPSSYNSDQADILFTGPQPTSVRFEEKTSFRHYLKCLHSQVKNSRKPTFDETVNAYEKTLDHAEKLLGDLHNYGVRGHNRDFKEIIDVNRAAISILKMSSGPRLKRNWNSL